MTYFGFLALFLGLPILLLTTAARRDGRRGRRLPLSLGAFSPAAVILFHVLVALLYTTPWDNYLVATGVWWYDPALVTGVTFGWVPLEEYVFFILQPILTGLWLLFAARRLSFEGENGRQAYQARRALRWAAVVVAGLIWTAAVAILVARWQPGTYLALELGWALPAIMLQLAFGADILWHRRRLVLLALLPPTLYLAAADAMAIGAGTWTIDPAQSVGLYLGGVLPVKEFVFFLLTNTLVVFGVTLALSRESARRLPRWIAPEEEGALLRSRPFAGNTPHTPETIPWSPAPILIPYPL